MSNQKTLNVQGVDGLRQLQKRIRVTKASISSYELVLARRLSEQNILKPIHNLMKSYNVSEKIISGTKLTRVEFSGKKIRIYITSVYFAGTYDVAKGRHDGTPDHDVFPQKKKALHFNGFFSKGHRVSGVPRLEYIKKIIEKNKQHVEDEFSRQKQIWVSKMLEVQ